MYHEDYKNSPSFTSLKATFYIRYYVKKLYSLHLFYMYYLSAQCTVLEIEWKQDRGVPCSPNSYKFTSKTRKNTLADRMIRVCKV